MQKIKIFNSGIFHKAEERLEKAYEAWVQANKKKDIGIEVKSAVSHISEGRPCDKYMTLTVVYTEENLALKRKLENVFNDVLYKDT